METSLLSLLGAKTGHFIFESGHHGNLWLDLDLLFNQPALLRPFVTELGRRLVETGADTICGPMTGGALLANMIAIEFDLHFVYTERVVALGSGRDSRVSYHLPDAFKALVGGRSIAVVDDVINAGSAVRGTIEALNNTDSSVVAVGSLLLLHRSGKSAHTAVHTNMISPETLKSELWPPSECPLCQSGIQIDLDVLNCRT